MCKVQSTDNELVARFLKGDETSLQSLIQRHEKKVYTSIYLLVKDRDQADDIFQETFIKVIFLAYAQERGYVVIESRIMSLNVKFKGYPIYPFKSIP